MKKRLLTFVSSLAFVPVFANAQQDPQFDARQQQRQAEQNKALEQQQIPTPDVRLSVEQEQLTAIPADESPCYPIKDLILTDFQPHIDNFADIPTRQISPSRFRSALKAVYAENDFTLPHCFGGEGIPFYTLLEDLCIMARKRLTAISTDAV